MTTPYVAFRQAGYEVEIAFIQGGKPPHDPGTLKSRMEENPPSVQSFLADTQATENLENTKAVDSLESSSFAAIYLPGGHGTMWDFTRNPALCRLVSDFYKAGKPVAAVCHGGAGFVGAQDDSGNPIVKDKRVNSFTDAEEKEVGLEKTVPYLLETALRQLGGNFECSGNFQKHVVQDANLITGQNPASAQGVAQAVIAFLQKKQAQHAA